MAGNDSVDLKAAAAESNWKRKGFVDKIFSLQEQQYINESKEQDTTVWRLWTMKESAYKIYTRQYGGRFFAPQKLNCTICSETAGNVTINNIAYQTNTSTTKDFIYSIAFPEAYSGFYSNCFVIPVQHRNNLQEFIYEKMIAHYARMRRADKHMFVVLKETNNIPFLYCKKEKNKIAVSITHHGRYAAFTIH